MEEEKTQATSTETTETETKEPTAEELKQELAKSKASEKGWQDTAAKWQRKHDEAKTQAEIKPEETYTEQTDPLAKLREAYDTDPTLTTAQMVDRAGRHYYSQLKKENSIKHQLRKSYKDFDEYEDKVDQWVEKLPFNKRTDPEMVEMAYKVAKAESLEDVDKVKEKAKEEGKKEATAETLDEAKALHAAGTPSGAEKETKTTVKMSPEDEKMATRYGMSKEEWAKWKTASKITPGQKAKFVK